MLSWLRAHWATLLLGLAALLLAGGVAYGELTEDGPPAIVFHGGSTPNGAPIRVGVAGAVRAPGVYDLRQGDRVAEVLAAAGGPAADADLARLDLTRGVRDGEEVLVPAVAACQQASAPPVDLNSACQAELEALPGIGAAYARRIIDSRLLDGPFASTQELVERRVIPQATFETIEPFIIVSLP